MYVFITEVTYSLSRDGDGVTITAFHTYYRLVGQSLSIHTALEGGKLLYVCMYVHIFISPQLAEEKTLHPL